MTSIEAELKQEVDAKSLQKFLARAHLPKNYHKLSDQDRTLARKSVLTSWFDPRKPQTLCTDVQAYIAAHFLFVEYYIKPDISSYGIYYYEDAQNKEEMLEMAFSPGLDPDEPNCFVCTASRRTGKTQTLIIEAMPFMCLVRPATSCLISEFNDKRTTEEISKIKTMLEQNERIHRDFGGPKVLFQPGDNWSKHELQFSHLPNCSIKGHSLGSAQRGRGIIYGVIDDPEDEDTVYNRDWREWFFDKLFNAYKPMFGPGGTLGWIGTPIDAGSCLSLAMRGQSERADNREAESDSSLTETRFQTWRRKNFSVIQRTPDGFVSLQPDRITVTAFLRKLALDPIAARKEILCEPVTPGTRVFPYNDLKHSYMHCVGDYVLDLCTWKETPWTEFLQGLKTSGGGDLADGQSDTADFGAVVIIGVDEDGVVYVLDALNQRCFIEALIQKAYMLAEEWKLDQMAWEAVALGKFIVRVIGRYVDDLRAKGRIPPILVPIENAKKNKIARIMTLRPYLLHQEIRFPRFEPITDPTGKVHTPLVHPRRFDLTYLLDQVREFTDKGLRGPDDLIDALEMAIRPARGLRGERPGKSKDDLETQVERWREVGLEMSLSPDRMSPKMLQEQERLMYSEVEEGETMMMELPYVGL